MADEENARTLDGRLVATTGRSELGGVAVWFSYTLTNGTSGSERSTTDANGNFSFPLPAESVDAAIVGAEFEGVTSVPFEVGGEVMEPGEIVLVVEDSLPAHLRHAGGG